MLLTEESERAGKRLDIKIFATVASIAKLDRPDTVCSTLVSG